MRVLVGGCSLRQHREEVEGRIENRALLRHYNTRNSAIADHTLVGRLGIHGFYSFSKMQQLGLQA